MLLDRKRINRYTRWAAIILAVVFLLSFVLLGVGSSSAGNVFSGCDGTNQPANLNSVEDREAYYLEQLEADPQDGASMLALANLYADDGVGRYEDAVDWFNKYLELNPDSVDVRIRIATIYSGKLGDPDRAIAILKEATTIAPDNANAFLQLGLAQRDAGQNQVAIMSLNHFLELDPTNSSADAVRQEIARLSTLPPVTETETALPGAEDIQVPAEPAP